MLRSLSTQLVALREDNTQVECAELAETAEQAVSTLVAQVTRANELAEQYRPTNAPARFVTPSGMLHLPDWRRAGKIEYPKPPSGRTLTGGNPEIQKLNGICALSAKG